MVAIQDKYTGMTAEILRMLVIYDIATGHFYWRGTDRFNNKLAGKGAYQRYIGRWAGTINSSGYIVIGFKEFGKTAFLAHRLAWLYVTGEWPLDQVDHKNKNKLDNRFENLREATHGQNMVNRNLLPQNTSGVTGVNYDISKGKWCAYLAIDRRVILSKTFPSFDDAVKARKEAEEKYYGEFRQ